MVKCYYRAGKDRKGFYEPCIDVVKRDEYRDWFCAELLKDDDFKNVKLRWTKKSAQVYMRRAALPQRLASRAFLLAASSKQIVSPLLWHSKPKEPAHPT